MSQRKSLRRTRKTACDSCDRCFKNLFFPAARAGGALLAGPPTLFIFFPLTFYEELSQMSQVG